MGTVILSLLGGGVAAVAAGRSEPDPPAAIRSISAEDLVFNRGDLPADQTWNVKFEHAAESIDGESSTESDDAEREVAACAGVDPEILFTEPDVEGNWVNGEGLEATSDVAIADSEEQAKSEFAIVSAQPFFDCFAKFFGDMAMDEVPAGVTVRPFARRLDGLPAIGDESVAYSLGVTMTGLGSTVEVVMTGVLARVGVYEVSLFFAGEPPGGFPDDLRQHLMAAIAVRAQLPA